MIVITRGDTVGLIFQRKDADGEVITTMPSEMYFTVKESWDSEQFIFQKTLSDMTMDIDGTWHIELHPDDTEELPYGTYVFDIEVTAYGKVKTICKDTLQVTEESTWRENK